LLEQGALEDSPKSKNNPSKINLLVVLLALILLSFIGGFSYLFMQTQLYLTDFKEVQRHQYDEQVRTRQFLLSTIDWKTSRQKMILFMRDQIVNEWRRCGWSVNYDKAYSIAEANMVESEKYPHLDPLLILSLQKIESAFNDRAVSPMGARGIMQVMPTTGRFLAFASQVSYHDSLLFNIKANIRFGCKYLDILHSDYPEMGSLLAGYNGGPYQAIYYTRDKSKLASETEKYVPKIKKQYLEYLKEYESYRLDEVIQYDSLNIASKLVKSRSLRRAPAKKIVETNAEDSVLSAK